MALNIVEDYQEMVESFSSYEYFGNVHVLETPDEGLCSLYYIELKPKVPANKSVQFAVLWKLLETYECHYNYKNKSGNELQEALRQEFQFIIDSWEPRAIESEDIKRAKGIVLECQSSFPNSSIREGWGTGRQVGYYLNDKFKCSHFPKELINSILNAKSGYVLSDDWNDFMLLIENKNAYSLFYWSTGA